MELVILPVLLVLMYLIVVRPQQQRLKAQRALVASLQVGDEVISSAGIFGTVRTLTDDVAVLEVAPGVELRFARQAMAHRVVADAAPDDADGAFGSEEPS